MRQLSVNLKFKTDYSKLKYYVASCNKEGYLWVSKWPALYNISSTIIYGTHGSGKTHLSSIWKNKTNAQVINLNMIKSQLPNFSIDIFPRDIIKLNQCFLIEDIEFGLNEGWLFDFYNLITESKKFVLITSKKHPKNHNFKLNDLKSRLLSSQIIELKLPSDDMCFAILKKNFLDSGMIVKDKKINHIIKKIDRSYESINHWSKIFENFHRENKRLTFSDINQILRPDT